MERTIKTRNICYPSFKHLRSLRMVQQRSGLIHKLRVDHPAGLHKCLVAAYFGKLTIPGTDWHFSMYCNVLFNVSISNYLVDATDSKKHVTLVLTVEGPYQTIKTYTTIMSVPSVLTMSWYWSCHWSIHALGFCCCMLMALKCAKETKHASSLLSSLKSDKYLSAFWNFSNVVAMAERS